MLELAPAKVNLFLKVIAKRQDGYHEIATLFEKIALFDEIKAFPSNSIDIECTNPDIPTDKKSLSYRTIKSIKDKYGVKKGIKVCIKKNIPVASGLGGGSSDAAAIISLACKIWKLRLSIQEKINIGKELGSDIPFFLTNTSYAIGSGKGDIINPIKSKKKIWHLIVNPPIKLLSKDIYELYSADRSLGLTIKPTVDTILPPNLNIDRLKVLTTLLHNDLEKVILAKEPIIRNAKEGLSSFTRGVLVSGSGPSLFAVFETRKEASTVKKQCLQRFQEAQGWRIFVVRTC